MSLRGIFDTFSRRGVKATKPLKRLTPAFRSRVLMACRDHFSPGGRDREFDSAVDYRHELWTEIQRRMAYLMGRPRLSNHAHIGSQAEDAVQFVSTCDDEHFLDFIEYMFQVDCYSRACPQENAMVEEINQLLLLENLPYALTPFVRETRTEHFLGWLREIQALVSAPRVVLREDRVTHAEAIQPAIQLLADKGFSSANQEFLAALEDYRKARYGDSLTKCCSAFESTMKLICARRGWLYSATDTAGPLLKVILANSTLDSYFEQPLLNIAMLRNRLSSAHGGGAQPRSVQPHRARYAINATAAAILLLIEECA